MRRLVLIYTIAVLSTVFGAPDQAVAQTPDRFAFVVGNHAYARSSDGLTIGSSNFNLKTPGRDAKRYVKTLGDLGWTVLNEKTANLTASGLEDELDKAASEITSGSEVLFVFNGHGFSEGSDNFLVGVFDDGKKYATVADMRVGSVTISDIVKRLAGANPSRIILVINACSDQPLHADVSLAPVKPDFDNAVDEILVLYSSSPKGIAYDVRDTIEGDDQATLSVFSRAFIPLLAEDRPLLSLFAQARIEVEGLSQRAASAQGLTERRGLQIPHVLFDSINGRFTVANVSRTLVSVAPNADWRIDPQACRENDAYFDEALTLRDSGKTLDKTAINQVHACILVRAKADLGIEKMGYNETERGVSVLQSSPGKTLVLGDVIKRLTIKRVGASRVKERFASVQQFRKVLAANYRLDAEEKYFYLSRIKGDDRKDVFEDIP